MEGLLPNRGRPFSIGLVNARRRDQDFRRLGHLLFGFLPQQARRSLLAPPTRQASNSGLFADLSSVLPASLPAAKMAFPPMETPNGAMDTRSDLLPFTALGGQGAGRDRCLRRGLRSGTQGA